MFSSYFGKIIGILAGVLFAHFFFAQFASANDSTAHLTTGGLVLARSDKIAIVEEDLYISRDLIKVRYRFRNVSNEDITTLVAFPMPDLVPLNDENNYTIPVEGTENFLAFSTFANGKPVEMNHERRAIALGVDRSSLLIENNIPFVPGLEETRQMLNRLSPQVRNEFLALGMLEGFEYDAGKGLVREYMADWTYKSTYYWRQTFPANSEIVVEHKYSPSLGASVGSLFGQELDDAYDLSAYQRYCVDEPFRRAALRFAKAGKGQGILVEYWLEYVLGTGSNWAGPIGKFRLVIDKSTTNHLVSFCGEGVKKIAQTQFEMVKKDYWPEGNLQVLFLEKVN